MTEFTREDKVKVKDLLSRMAGDPIPFDKQRTIFNPEGRCLWCEEWETIEMLKYIINGRDNYFLDPPPNRLKNSGDYKEKIAEKIEKIILEMNNIEELIEYFKHRRELYGSA